MLCVYALRLCTTQSLTSIHNPSPRGRQARMPESERPKCGTDDAPQSVHKGLGDGDGEFFLLIEIAIFSRS